MINLALWESTTAIPEEPIFFPPKGGFLKEINIFK
jgi:hypothetical protein